MQSGSYNFFKVKKLSNWGTFLKPDILLHAVGLVSNMLHQVCNQIL